MDKEIIQLVVITVKRDKSVKVALNAQAVNKEVIRDRYQMPNLEKMVDMVIWPKMVDNEKIVDMAKQLDNKLKGQLYTLLSICVMHTDKCC